MRRLLPFYTLLGAGLLFSFTACQSLPDEPLPPFVQPPIPAANPAFSSFSFLAEEGWEYIHPSGSRFTIPAHALVNAQGEPVTGRVEGRFREFHDATGIFLAGIPMEFGGGSFTTAGSFELRVEQEGNPLELKEGVSMPVRLASYESADDFQFYYLDETGRKWDSLGTATPEVNQEKIELQEKIQRMQPSLAFPLNRNYLSFNYGAILDVYYKDDLKHVDHEMIEKKMKAYGLGWEDCYVYESITFRGKDVPAALMVWKNVDGKKFPEWTRGRRGILSQVKGSTYMCKFTTKDPSQVFEVRLRAVMALNELFAFPPDEWKDNYEATLAKIEEERIRMEAMAEVYRSFEVRSFGIYNWDKLLKEDDRVMLAGDFHFPVEINEQLTELTVVLITGDGKGIIKYPEYTWDNMALVEDPDARFFTVLPGSKVALYPPADFRKIDFSTLRKETSPSYVFQMKLLGREIRSEADFRAIFGEAI